MSSSTRSCGTWSTMTVSSSSEVGSIQWTSSKIIKHRLHRCQALEPRQKHRQCLLLSALRTQLWQAVAVAGRQRQKVGQKCYCLISLHGRLHEQHFELGEL